MPISAEDLETRVTMETGDGALPDEMPFKMLLIGDWSGRGDRPASLDFGLRRPQLIDRDNYEDVLRKISPELALDLDGETLKLRFAELDDFHPDRIFHQISFFKDLRETRRNLANPQTFNQAAHKVREWLTGGDEKNEPDEAENNLEQIVENQPAQSDNLLDHILSGASGEVPQNLKPGVSSDHALNNLLGELVRPFVVQADEAEQSKLIHALDAATGELMRKILHHPNFKRLEAAWRGIYFLISRAATDVNLKIYLFDVTKDELKTDLKSVKDLTDSGFYKLLNETTVGSYTEESWAAVFADFFFSMDVDDIAAMMRIAQIGADTDTPFVAQADGNTFGTNAVVADLDVGEGFTSINAAETRIWTMLREMPEAAYLGLTTPRMMARVPYGAKSEPTENFDFEEISAASAHEDDLWTNHEDYLWANSVFACALAISEDFAADGWQMQPGATREIENAPMHLYKEEGETKIKTGAEHALTLKGVETMLNFGLMPLLAFRDSDRVRLARIQSIASPKKPLQGKWS